MAVILPPNSTGSTVDTVQATTGKERQICSLGDTATGVNVATVDGLVGSVYAGGLVVLQPVTSSLVHTPAAATQATVSVAAVSGVQFVAQSISFSVAVDGTHAQTAIQVNLRDGATGAGTILWSTTVLKAATEAETFFHVGGLNIVGTSNHAMTLEFSAAGVAGSLESVSLTYYAI
jgi:hypothetical protein